MNTHERLVKKLKIMYDEVQLLRLRVAELEQRLGLNKGEPVVLDSIDDDAPCCEGNPPPPETT